MNISCSIWVKVRPYLYEFNDMKVCDTTAIFALHIAEALKRYCYEKIDQYKAAPKYI